MMSSRQKRFNLFIIVSLVIAFTMVFISYKETLIVYEYRSYDEIEMAAAHDHHYEAKPEKTYLRVDTVLGPHHHGYEDDSLAQLLYREVRVLCWIMTSPSNLNNKALAVKKTWAKRFNVHVFISSQTNQSFPTVGLDVQEGREHLTAKTMKAYQYMYDRHFDEADWFMKADDDTYVIVENLRFFLSHYNPHEPIYFGFRFKPFIKQGYMSGGAGYVLSKAALVVLIAEGMNKPDICRQDQGAEDVEIGKCLYNLGVKAGNSSDIEGRETFHPFKIQHHLEGNYPEWFLQYAFNKAAKGYGCCSDFSITFHYMTPSDIYFLDFVLYHLRPFGIAFQVPSKRMFGQADVDIGNTSNTSS